MRIDLAFQIGETAQIMSGGVLRATPHAVQAVRWPESASICRNTFALFMEPNFDVKMDLPPGRTLKVMHMPAASLFRVADMRAHRMPHAIDINRG